VSIERDFDVAFTARLASAEKQIQQVHRPVVGVHKWFARRPGALFRALMLAEFAEAPLREAYWQGHSFPDETVADPFMGGGTSVFEANRMGFRVAACDVNPMAWWVVRQELAPLDRVALLRVGEELAARLEAEIGDLYRTRCRSCGGDAQVKYFLWVKRQRCGGCAEDLDLFASHLVAKNARHTHFVLHCPACRQLVERTSLPGRDAKVACPACKQRFAWAEGAASRGRYVCGCGHSGRSPEAGAAAPPRHRLFGMELHCASCRPKQRGRLFATAENEDLACVETAQNRFAERADLVLPQAEIPAGDETRRLHRWGYRRWSDLFNERQLLGLGLLLCELRKVEEPELGRALATVFSDFLRYQNLLCRYDPYALKCQDIFAVHGFPVGLTPCENNLLGIPGVGAGGFRHFLAKYGRAKAWCDQPWETRREGRRSRRVDTPGERVAARFVQGSDDLAGERPVLLRCASFEELGLPDDCIDAVFTDPPYFANVQYAELMDFCHAWLRLAQPDELPEIDGVGTRSASELTGNQTSGRGLSHFAAGLSRVFRAAARALRPGGPFVFTYHHNEVKAYAPLVVAILDAGLGCSATLPAPAEMTASLHIRGTRSSVVDSVFVCRHHEQGARPVRFGPVTLQRWLDRDGDALARGGVRATAGDLRCLELGHLARVAVSRLANGWGPQACIESKLAVVLDELQRLESRCAGPDPLLAVAPRDQAT
jgi:adenine-specific DNA methylase